MSDARVIPPLTDAELSEVEAAALAECGRGDEHGPVERTFHHEVVRLVAEVRAARAAARVNPVKSLELASPAPPAAQPEIEFENWYCDFCMYPFRAASRKCPLCQRTDNRVRRNRQE